MEKKVWKKNLPKRRPIYRFTEAGNGDNFTDKGDTTTLITTTTAIVFNAGR
ncbi:hypothetical protein [Mucilaginibacter aquaedulcis]|jgi:hypothetical protein|uniref:hypothetical protein n=1 Tax=Mucilaginibacter aquaedulcis TaxID=1187081 RepID=UPI0025B32B26|nr:hypothetical protein [Mucilaginibacter aquaedulcis]MDN3547283.1 hypothetical protein [Mucilaginibacter aquaedulcis]